MAGFEVTPEATAFNKAQHNGKILKNMEAADFRANR
jgi:hypothetical protein